jgi:hypothetical protein
LAITFVNAGLEAAAASGNITLAEPASPVSGDIWIASIHTTDNVAHALTDWTEIHQANGGSAETRLSLWWFRYAGSLPNLVVAHTSGNTIIGGIGAYRGCVASGDVIDTEGAFTTHAGSATITFSGITPAASDTMLVASDGADDSNSRSAIPSSFTTVLEDSGGGTQNAFVTSAGSNGTVAQYYRIWTSGATGDFTATSSTAEAGAQILFALKPATSGYVPYPVSQMSGGMGEMSGGMR